MIRVTVEILQDGDPSRAKQFAEVDIWNDSGTTAEVCDYRYEATANGKPIAKGEVGQHRRKDG